LGDLAKHVTRVGQVLDDVAGLTGEHLIHSHPSISVVLCKLFKIIMQCRYVPAGFRHGYIVPIPKLKETRSKPMSCDDFRGIAISPIISKVVEHCVLDRFQIFFSVLMLSLVSRKV